MKRAKSRLSPTLLRLRASTSRAARAMIKSIAHVEKSNRRLANPRPKYTLAELLAQMPPGEMPIDVEWDRAPPVGREIL